MNRFNQKLFPNNHTKKPDTDKKGPKAKGLPKDNLPIKIKIIEKIPDNIKVKEIARRTP